MGWGEDFVRQVQGGEPTVADQVRRDFNTDISSRHFTPEMNARGEQLARQAGDTELADKYRRKYASSAVRRLSKNAAHKTSDHFNESDWELWEDFYSGDREWVSDVGLEKAYQKSRPKSRGVLGWVSDVTGINEFEDLVYDVIPKELWAVADLYTGGLASPIVGGQELMHQSSGVFEDVLGINDAYEWLSIPGQIAFTAGGLALGGPAGAAAGAAAWQGVQGLAHESRMSDTLESMAWAAGTGYLSGQFGPIGTAVGATTQAKAQGAEWEEAALRGATAGALQYGIEQLASPPSAKAEPVTPDAISAETVSIIGSRSPPARAVASAAPVETPADVTAALDQAYQDAVAAKDWATANQILDLQLKAQPSLNIQGTPGFMKEPMPLFEGDKIGGYAWRIPPANILALGSLGITGAGILYQMYADRKALEAAEKQRERERDDWYAHADYEQALWMERFAAQEAAAEEADDNPGGGSPPPSRYQRGTIRGNIYA